ncbi:MAG: Nif3-like dinuclear metal center hexameric protein [Clostridiales bacterium]|nr:Nif3-like dinuclear metal center hexameric protein [Clostridiales bacterium]
MGIKGYKDSGVNDIMKPYEIMRHIRASYLQVEPDEIPYDDSEMKRCVSYGDKYKTVESIAVAMESTPMALKKAYSLGCDLFIAHHETFGFPDDTFEANRMDPRAITKKDILDRSGMTVIRVHGTWDLKPVTGIFDTWIRLLGYHDCEWVPCVPVPKWEPWIREAVFMKMIMIPPIKLGDLAKHVAKVVAPYGQNGVLVTGDSERIIRKLGVGDGGITDPRSYYDTGCNAGIVTSMENFNCWANEVGIGLVYVDHVVSELQGMKNLAQYLTDTLPHIKVHYIDNGCAYKVVIPD